MMSRRRQPFSGHARCQGFRQNRHLPDEGHRGMDDGFSGGFERPMVETHCRAEAGTNLIDSPEAPPLHGSQKRKPQSAFAELRLSSYRTFTFTSLNQGLSGSRGFGYGQRVKLQDESKRPSLSGVSREVRRLDGKRRGRSLPRIIFFEPVDGRWTIDDRR